MCCTAMEDLGGFGGNMVLSQHMAAHIFAMSVVAPLLALAWHRVMPSHDPGGRIWWAGGLQLALFVGWHLPAVLALAMHVQAVLLAMHASLFLSALWFWRCVVAASGNGAWRAIAVLAITGKIVCLFGILLLLAPAPLYPAAMPEHVLATSDRLLDDQQLAGLLMLAACPLTYVLAGVVIAARWLSRVDRDTPWSTSRRAA